MWNRIEHGEEHDERIESISRIFLVATFALAIIFGISWLSVGTVQAIKIFTAVLIVACPCALALSGPFTFGFAEMHLNKLNMYLKNISAVEKIANCTTAVFDKTGTLSSQEAKEVTFKGNITDKEKVYIKSLCCLSTHPVSTLIVKYLKETPTIQVNAFRELPGIGIQGIIEGKQIILAKAANFTKEDNGTWVKIGERLVGAFYIENTYRNGLKSTLKKLNKISDIKVLSGDNDREKAALQTICPPHTEMLFNQLPEDKMDYIQSLESKTQKSMMIGDGLNDAGALNAATAGIAVTENFSRFFPACDAILDASKLQLIDKIVRYCRWSKNVNRFNLIISLLYNTTGLYLAATGILKPVYCAILMPASSISVIFMSAIGCWAGSQKILKETS